MTLERRKRYNFEGRNFNENNSPDQPVPLSGFLKDFLATGGISEAVFRKIARENAIKLFVLAET